MDQVDVRSLSLVITFIAFVAIAWWAFSPSRKKRFEEDAKLPFAEDDLVNAKRNDAPLSDDNERQKEV